MSDTDQTYADDLLKKAYSLQNSEEAKALYAEWAKTYDHTMLVGLGYVTPKNTAALLAEYVPNAKAKILDIGSGTGLAGVELAALGYVNLDALDYSAEMLAVAKRREVYHTLIEADLNQTLDLPANTYDALICTGTFTHAHVGAGCLEELFRILKPGGIFACTVHNEIWEPAGFAAKVAELTETGLIKTLHHKPGPYYSTSTSNEGAYIVWKKR